MKYSLLFYFSLGCACACFLAVRVGLTASNCPNTVPTFPTLLIEAASIQQFANSVCVFALFKP